MRETLCTETLRFADLEDKVALNEYYLVLLHSDLLT